MGDDSNNALARRREIRKQKILENAELRKQKIFGYKNISDQDANSSIDEIPVPVVYSHPNGKANDIHLTTRQNYSGENDETGSTKSMESEYSSKSIQNEDEDSSADIRKIEGLKNIPDPAESFTDYQPKDEEDMYQHDLSNIAEEQNFYNSSIQPSDESAVDYNSKEASNTHSRINSSLFSNGGNYSINTEPSIILAALEHPMAPCILALIVSFLISFNLGYLVSNSLVIPFFVWELQQIIATYGLFLEEEKHTSFIEAVLLILGIKKGIIIKYIWILKLLKDIFEDFSIYILTVVVWQIFIGFPPLKV